MSEMIESPVNYHTSTRSDSIQETRLDDSLHRQHSQDRTMDCFSEKLKMKFHVHIQDNTEASQQRCHIVTIHDLGYNNEFEDFVSRYEMRELTKRIVWVHVSLPGQESGAADLPHRKYPSLVDLADGLICVFEALKIPQAVMMGDGCGANVAVEFAAQHPERCQGLALVEPILSPAGFFETVKYKYLKIQRQERSNSISQDGDMTLRKDSVCSNGSDGELIRDGDLATNPKNLSMLAHAYTNRESLKEKIGKLSCDMLVIAGRDSAHYEEANKFYEALRDSRRNCYQNLVNCPFLEIEKTTAALEVPERVATSLGFFLQGLGLLSAMPFKKRLSVSSRSMSMEEADRPRNMSITSNADSLISETASSTHSISE